MKIIGITGKAGSGKTILANMIAKEKSIDIIHMDYILDGIKESKALSKMTQNAEQVEDKENTHKMVKSNLSDFIYSNGLILEIYLKFRNIIINRILNKKIKEYEEKNIENLIVEGLDLINLDIMKKLDIFVLMKTPYNTRIERALKRDGVVDRKIIVNRDRKSQKNIRGKIKRKIDFTLENTGSIEELEKDAELILKFLKEKEMTPEEKFRKKNKLVTKMKSITKTKQDKGRNRGNDEKIY